MTMLSPALMGLLLISPVLQAQDGGTSDSTKIDLRILVTGVKGSERLSDFRSFLENEFRKVGTTDYSGFTPTKAKDYDVVIFDAKITPSPGRIGLPKGPKLPEDYNRASVLVSGAGAILSRQLHTKTDWG